MPPKKTKTSKSIPVMAHKHSDKRANIPTKELRDFVEDQEKNPKIVLYPRDASLDPQLVWKGKDEQDSRDLAVPAVPIYIQEKIHPQAIIENVRAEVEKGRPQAMSLFADFNGIKFEDLIDFYHHEQNWANRFILGDSLLVMTSLAEKEKFKGKVKMIFIDPPYGIDFGSNWQVSTRKKVVKDGKAEDITRQPEQIRAFRDMWSLGIHSYLGYIRDRLAAANDLLTEFGSIFVQIGQENFHLIRSLMDEVFGSENAHPPIVFRKKMMPMMKEPGFESMCDYILWYQNNKSQGHGLRKLFEWKSAQGDSAWSWCELPTGERRQLTESEVMSHKLLPPGTRVFSLFLCCQESIVRDRISISIFKVALILHPKESVGQQPQTE